MVLADVAAGLLIGAVPLLWWRSALSLPVLFLLMAAKAVSGVGQSAFASPLVVDLLEPGDVVGATGKINGTMSATDIVGQALGGGLLSVLSAPLILLVDALSFFVSGGLASRIRAASTEPSPAERTRLSVPDLVALGRALLRRRDFLAVLTIALVNGVTQTVFVIYCTRTLHIAPALLGPLLAIGAVGGVVGGLLSGRIDGYSHRIALLLGLVGTLWSLVPLPLVHGGVPALLAVVNFELAGAFGGTVIIAAAFGAIQTSASAGTVARTMAIATNGLQIAALVGAAVGGIVGDATDTRTVLTVAVALMAVSTILCGWRHVSAPS
jgi:predicted MFS family arabinose efflux permease